MLERLPRSLESVAIDTVKMGGGAVAAPSRATHGAVAVDRSLVECRKTRATRSRMTGQGGWCRQGMVVACFPVHLEARCSKQARILQVDISLSYSSG